MTNNAIWMTNSANLSCDFPEFCQWCWDVLHGLVAMNPLESHLQLYYLLLKALKKRGSSSNNMKIFSKFIVLFFYHF